MNSRCHDDKVTGDASQDDPDNHSFARDITASPSFLAIPLGAGAVRG